MKIKAFTALAGFIAALVLNGCEPTVTAKIQEPRNEATVVTLTAIPGVTPPVLGITPVSVITETAQYTGTVSWNPAVSGTFAANTVYTATITLTPKAGFTFTGIAANSFTVAGAASVNNSANSGLVTAVFPSTGAAPVSLTTITGVTPPVLGITPVSMITETAQYTGMVSWNPAVTGTFAANTVYTATITLTPKAGFTFTGTAANSFTVAGAMSVSNGANSGVVTAAFPSTGAAPVSLTSITGVTPPVLGNAPVSVITETAQYTGTVSWNPAVTGTFAANTVYTATITLTPKAGFTFTGTAANSFTVAGAMSVSNGANSGVVTATFPATGAAPVSLTSITGVTPPVLGNAPVSVITETTQYTGTVSWNPAVTGTFAANTVYTATITLTPKAGFTFTGTAANSFTVAGAMSVSKGANSGVVTAAFPSTGAAPVSLTSITGVTPPVLGNAPNYTITETEQFTGTISWIPAVSGTFAANTVYTATITLSPKAGFTFTGTAANSFTVAGAMSVSNGANSGVVTATFPATGAAPVSLFTLQGVTPPIAGNAPVTVISETAQYTGTVSWSPTVSNTFSPLTEYTATISLTPKSGFTLSGVAENSFTVTGAVSVSNIANSGVVIATFPETPEATVSLLEISGIEAPVLGALPVITVTETEQYTGNVYWSGVSTWSDRFGGQKAYYASIVLTPKHGYSLSGVPANSFSVPGATRVTHDAGAEIIWAEFPATAAAHIGDNILGGVVVYILQRGDDDYVSGEQRGIIAATSNQSSYAYWCKNEFYNVSIPGTSHTRIGTGRINTRLICAMNGEGTNYAAGIARAYTGGGYTDWYLPSRDELALLVDMKDSIALLSSCYYSSSEFDAQSAHIVWNDRYLDTNPKCSGGSRAVRAVRNF